MAKFKAKGHSNSIDCPLPSTGGCRYMIFQLLVRMIKVDDKENSILNMYCKIWTGIVEWNHHSYTPVTMVLLGICEIAAYSMLWHIPKSHYPLTPFIHPLYLPYLLTPLSTPISSPRGHFTELVEASTVQTLPIPWHCGCCYRSFCWNQKSATFPRKQFLAVSPYRNKESMS